jgi:hypothetical protein
VDPAVTRILEIADEEDLDRARIGRASDQRTFRHVPHQPIRAATKAKISSGWTTKVPTSLWASSASPDPKIHAAMK